jgi:hypothetical protein
LTRLPVYLAFAGLKPGQHLTAILECLNVS